MNKDSFRIFNKLIGKNVELCPSFWNILSKVPARHAWINLASFFKSQHANRKKTCNIYCQRSSPLRTRNLLDLRPTTPDNSVQVNCLLLVFSPQKCSNLCTPADRLQDRAPNFGRNSMWNESIFALKPATMTIFGANVFVMLSVLTRIQCLLPKTCLLSLQIRSSNSHNIKNKINGSA